MGKTPKKAAPEGDERNRYVRRIKNTSSSSSSSSSKQDDITANLIAARSVHTEYENTNRGKPATATNTGVSKNLKTSSSSSKNFKSKLRSPVVKSSLNRLPKSTTTTTTTTNKAVLNEKETSRSGTAGITSSKVFKHKTFIMQPKSESEFERDIESREQRNEDIREECIVDDDTIVIIKSKKVDTVIESDEIVVQEGDNKANENDTEVEIEAEIINEKEKDADEDKNGEENVLEKIVEVEIEDEINDNENNDIEVQINNEVVSEILEDDDSKEETEEHEVKLNLTIEDSPLKVNLKEEINVFEEPETADNDSQEITELQKENGHVREETDEQNEDLADTESCSVDVVESTTSEVSENSETALIETEKTTPKDQSQKEDVSFVSFDASIMLKDAQVRLNDCLKDNSKLFDITNDERSISEPLCKDSSFGRTLRNISGRHSINRMRHVTLRSRLSPNSSLFVNMSSASLPDDDIRDHKILRHRTGLDTTLTCNGTPKDRKRKLEPEVSSEAKKVKTESESSFFNTSINILQGIRRPIQVSTPNAGGYKFKDEKLDISGIGSSNDDKIGAQEESGNAKKWCSIM